MQERKKKRLERIEVSKCKKEWMTEKGNEDAGILNRQEHADGKRSFHVMMRAADR
jgi:hypothetical protein